METDPRRVRLSDHFLLSDFLGNHSVYSRGYANAFDPDDPEARRKIDNAQALCEHGLEPLLRHFGPLSVSYGYISPELSRRIVKYQDPDKPSHHLWNLGAACDFCPHRWIAGDFKTIIDLYLPGSAVGSPIAFAHGVDYLEIPYSRLITYSESPYLCLAISTKEVEKNQPRKAFYENRYMGVPKIKPDYRQYPNETARARALEELQNQGLEHAWIGSGYPTYHGGGREQYQHMRVSKYTVVSDWLFDLKSISEGHKNIPSMNLDTVQDAFAAAGIVYDWMIDVWGIPRASIVGGYVSHLNPNSRPRNDWRKDKIRFTVSPPENGGNGAGSLFERVDWLNEATPEGAQFKEEDGFVVAMVEVGKVLTSTEFE